MPGAWSSEYATRITIYLAPPRALDLPISRTHQRPKRDRLEIERRLRRCTSVDPTLLGSAPCAGRVENARDRRETTAATVVMIVLRFPVTLGVKRAHSAPYVPGHAYVLHSSVAVTA